MAASKLLEIHPATPPHVPHELVSDILARLPVGTLQRFRCVCKAWCDIISEDPYFLRAHLRRQRLKDPWLLIAPQLLVEPHDHRGTCFGYTGWYQLEEAQRAVPSLVYAPDSPWLLPTREVLHKVTHCDGLVLVPGETMVRVLNPATRRVLELAGLPNYFYRNQTYGIGHDPRSDTYKVVRLFRCCLSGLRMNSSQDNNVTTQVFTIGTDLHWRDTTVQPPYPVSDERTATYCKGFLFWTVDHHWVLNHIDRDVATQGLICFSLEDESFSVMLTPWRNNSTCCLAELRGELCVAHLGPGRSSIEMWICSDFVSGGVNPPRWYRRDIIKDFMYNIRSPLPLAASREGNIFFERDRNSYLSCYDTHTQQWKDLVYMSILRFQDPDKNKGTFIDGHVVGFDVIPYIPSLVPI